MKAGVTTVLVAGSGEWDSWDQIRAALEPYFGVDVTLLTNGQRGAAKMSEFVWENWGGTVRSVAPNWERFGSGAGYRNMEGLALSGPNVAVCFVKGDDPVMKRNAEIIQQREVPIVTVAYINAEDAAVANAGHAANTEQTEPAF
jgi:hypothetical protein